MPKPSGIYVQKTFTFNCPNTSLCLEILEKVNEELSLKADVYVEFKMNKLVFRFIGLEPNVQEAMNKVREFLSIYSLNRVEPRRGISMDVISKHINKTIPLEVLAVVIRKTLSVSVDVKNNYIYANTDLDTLLTIAKKVAESQQKVEKMQVPSSLKKLLIAAMAIHNVSHVDVIEALQRMQYLNEKNELTVPWVKALDDIEELLKEA